MENIKNRKFLIATPCYGGMLTDRYFYSILALQKVLILNNIEYEIFAFGNESLITRARNACVAYCLSKDFTHLFFIDADISFSPISALRLMQSESDVICGPYPKKSINWSKIRDMILKDPSIDINKLNASSSDYVINYDPKYLKKTETGEYTTQCVNGIIKVLDSGTGFMCIKKELLQRMREYYPDLKYNNDIPGYNSFHEDMKNNFYLFFDCMKDEDGRYLSEDYAFCRRVQKMGHTIDLDITCDLSHTGSYTYKGSIKSTFN